MAFLTYIDSSWFIANPLLASEGSFSNAELNANIEVNVFPEWYKQITLNWKIPQSWGNCSFHVYYDEGVNTSIRRLTNESITTPYFADTKNQEYLKFKKGFYTVEVILPNGKRVKSYPTSSEVKRRSKIEKIANEIQRREYMLLSKFVGVKSFFFKRKTYGTRCPRCWNPTLEKVMDDHCPVCFGTSFEGGYYDPIPVFLQYEQTNRNKLADDLGIVEPNQISGWTISVPEMSPRDVIMRGGDYNVYKVISIQNTELQTKQVRQIVTLTQYNKGDILHLLDKTNLFNDKTYLSQGIESKYTESRFPTKNLDNSLINDNNWVEQKETHLLPKYQIEEVAPPPPIPPIQSDSSFINTAHNAMIFGSGEALLVGAINALTEDTQSSILAESFPEASFSNVIDDAVIQGSYEQQQSEAQLTITTSNSSITGSASSFTGPDIFFAETFSNDGLPTGRTGLAVDESDFFITNVTSPATITFESEANETVYNTSPRVISFPAPKSTLTATFTSTSLGSKLIDEVITGTNNAGRFNVTTSGSKFLEFRDNLLITFSSPITAFGLFGTDWGDFLGQVKITLNYANITPVTYVIPHSKPATSGCLVFWGFISTEPVNSLNIFCEYDTVQLEDYLGIDDIIVAN